MKNEHPGADAGLAEQADLPEIPGRVAVSVTVSGIRTVIPNRRDADLARELDAYIADEIEDQIAAGRTPEEARSATLRKLGNVTRVREQVYERNSLVTLETLWTPKCQTSVWRANWCPARTSRCSASRPRSAASSTRATSRRPARIRWSF